MFAVKANIYGVLYNQSSSIVFDETSSYWSAPKSPNFSAFHWSPHSSLVSIGQHFVTMRVVHLPKRTETSFITEADLITESDQAVRTVHSCNSWFYFCPLPNVQDIIICSCPSVHSSICHSLRQSGHLSSHGT